MGPSHASDPYSPTVLGEARLNKWRYPRVWAPGFPAYSGAITGFPRQAWGTAEGAPVAAAGLFLDPGVACSTHSVLAVKISRKRAGLGALSWEGVSKVLNAYSTRVHVRRPCGWEASPQWAWGAPRTQFERVTDTHTLYSSGRAWVHERAFALVVVSWTPELFTERGCGSGASPPHEPSCCWRRDHAYTRKQGLAQAPA